MPAGFGLLRRKGRRERGAVAVETALVSLLLITIMAGIIDSSMLFRDGMVLATASRAGARTGASEPLAATFAADTAQQAVAAMSDLDLTRVTKIWVYKASLTTGPPVSCSSDCVQFTVSASGTLSSPIGTWGGRFACGGLVRPLDAVGVLVEYRHPSTMGFFFANRVLKEYAVMQLEPIPSTKSCVSS